MSNEDKYISQTEAAKLMGKSLQSVNNLVKRGRLQVFIKYGAKRLLRSEVVKFKRQNPGPKPKQK